MSRIANEIDKKIGEFLRGKRKKCGLVLSDVEAITGKSKFTLSGYENGRNSITAQFLMELCKLYGTDIGEVYQYVYNEKNN